MLRKICLLFLCIYVTATASALKYEAEDGDMFGTQTASDARGYSGSGYVTFISYDTSSVGINVTVDESADYIITLRALNTNDKDTRVSVKVEYDEEGYVASQRLNSNKKFSDVYVNNSVYLEQGDHSFYITGLKGEWNLDYIELTKATDRLTKELLPPRRLVTKSPSKEAKALYDYLCDMKGKGILSGQQIYSRQPEMKVIYEQTGKYPAIIGIDLMDYSPTRVSHGTRGTTVNEAKKWWNDGGIITCCWHWNAPMDLLDLDEDGKRWYDGFRPAATTYNFVTALQNHDSEEYKTMIRDIDTIARQLKSLQDDNIPVLWRPLHEASGGWFWWGARGADAYIELYRFLFDRLVNYHKLNNLIWIWNGQDPDWYPGDDYVDVVSYDSYPSEREYKPLYDELVIVQSATAQPKLCALSENGTLPDIDTISNQKIGWSWFCTWNGEFVMDKNQYSSRYTDLDTFKRFYNNEYLITRDELPSFKN